MRPPAVSLPDRREPSKVSSGLAGAGFAEVRKSKRVSASYNGLHVLDTSMSSPLEPTSDELAELYSTQENTVNTATDIPTFSDDLAAIHDLQAERKRVQTEKGVVIQNRIWSTQEIFRSDPPELTSSQDMAAMPFITSSPPPTPSPQKKRKFADLDLGHNQLARPAKAKRTYYGINIHQLLEDAQAEESIPKEALELPTPPAEQASHKASLLWTEKYRAKKFTDLIGDERTHRSVMHWLKRWDQTVFPGSYRPKAKAKGFNEPVEEKPHRKILMLTGPPGLGKTTLAHVCAKQAGYEVQEINASDERSGNVVKGRIRDMLGTENVRGVEKKTDAGKVRKSGKPVCVVVDEVDGVVSGSGGSGEGGFVKALIDLVNLDQKNSSALGTLQQAPVRKKKGDRFRLLRPMILICNDVYHPSLRPLRQGSYAEIIHVRKPPVQTLVSRLQSVFEKEGVPCESDGVRRLCEATWGVSNRKEDRNGAGAGEGDMRGEWVAGKLRSINNATGNARLTRRWVEENVLSDLGHGGGATRGLGRGGPKDIVERVFQEGAGFPKSSVLVTPQHQTAHGSVKGVAEGAKRTAGERLRELVDTLGDTDRIMTDCFSSYPEHPFQDDTYLSKPDSAYEWLNFHDRLSSAVYRSNEWELAPYLSTPVLAFHHLFASPTRAQYANVPLDDADTTETTPSHPFHGTQASWAAHEAEKHNTALLQSLQSSLDSDLSRHFSRHYDIATDLLPYLLRMLSPNVNPVVVGGSNSSGGTSTASVRKASEQQLIQRAVHAMGASGVRFDRTKVSSAEDGVVGPAGYGTQWIYRMEPSLDELGTFQTGGKGFGESGGKMRYAVRQVLDQEWTKEEKRRAEVARLKRFTGGVLPGVGEVEMGGAESLGKDGEKVVDKVVIKRDFFGRPITFSRPTSSREEGNKSAERQEPQKPEEEKVWVTYHEGFSNAVRKPLTLAELMKDL
ncbi:Chromosome transmission fidelity protein 18 [Saxophila tyrrhenica]|uniref:Chromosome transmission fidelity protein 18 n=1 Tax=Saxophila tyrrhenica TaxID=1690608 RepID=A0AAV9PSW2_9PEZI|nr:Chromosome transmission fidelity protein 18 [Saxophila tyrrhenica]